jgi:Lhr-like helicase
MDLIWKSSKGKQKLSKMCTTHLQNAIDFISNNHKPKDLIYTVRADVWVKNMSLTIADRHLKQINTRLAEIKEINQSLRVEFDELNMMKENITQLKLQL